MEATESAEKYKSQSRHYLGNAFKSIEAGDSEKASEFLWGSMAEVIKAAAASKGIQLRSHRDLVDYARGLAKELGDESIWNAFDRAQSLHSNFYETGLLLEDVYMGAQDVRAAVTKLFGAIDRKD